MEQQHQMEQRRHHRKRGGYSTCSELLLGAKISRQKYALPEHF
jgi:hypothetical protein